jgi:hypothetical protein
LSNIKLFGPTQAAIDIGQNEMANGWFTTEVWWVYTAPDTNGDGEECIRADRTTTHSGYYWDSSVITVPK